MADLSDEAKKRAKEIERAGAQAAAFFSKLRNEALALAGVFTAGMGIKSFIESTIGSAVNLGFMAQNLKMSTQELQAWQRAAQRSGSTAEAITNQLKESATELANVKMGRSSEAATEFYRQGGIDVRNFKDGNEFLLARSKIIHDLFQVDPSRAMLVAQRMGINEDTFNLIKQGPEAIQALIDAQKKNSQVTEEQSKKALELQNQWLDFKQGMETTATQLVLKLAPAFTVIIKKVDEISNKFIAWVGDGKDVNKWVDDFINKYIPSFIRGVEQVSKSIESIAQSLEGVIKKLNEAADAVGGWKVILLGLVGIKVAEFTLSLVSMATSVTAAFLPAAAALAGFVAAYASVRKLNDATGGKVDYYVGKVFEFFGDKGASHEAAKLKPRSKEDIDKANAMASGDGQFKNITEKSTYAVKRLMDKGWTKEQASGMVGSLMQESSTLNENETNKQSGAYGVAQWLDKSRIAAFEKFAGRPLKGSSFDQQLDFMNYELTEGSYKKAGNAIKGAQSVGEAAELHRKLYEIPGEQEANDVKRRANGEKVYGAVNDAVAPPVAAVDSRSYAKSFSPVAAAGVRGNVNTNDVTINGDITVHTKATDAAGVADGLRLAIQERLMPSQSNTGLV